MKDSDFEATPGFVEVAPRLAHEALNLACGLRGVEELLRDGCPEEALARVASLAQRIERLGRHLGQYAKASLLGLSEVDLSRLLTDAMAAARPLAEERAVAIRDGATAGHAAGGLRTLGDEGSLALVLSNLLRYVVVRTPVGGTVEILRSATALDGEAGVAVAIGTTRPPGAAAPAIVFRPFAPRLGSESGLELAIAQRAARAHGGAVTAVNRGDRLVLTLTIPAIRRVD